MKRFLLGISILVSSLAFNACSSKEDSPAPSSSTSGSSSGSSSTADVKCNIHNGKQLYKGPQGGCYYINSNGNKTYVDRSECNC